MPTHNWMYFGRRPILDNTPSSNATQAQANVANGWTATGTGPNRFALASTTGNPVNSSGGYNTTYQSNPNSSTPAPANFSYRNPVLETTHTNQQIVSFLSVTIEVKAPAYAGGATVTRQGVLIQMRNGDVFLRPTSSTVNDWNSITAIERITVRNAAPFPQSSTQATYVAPVGYNQNIANTALVCFAKGTRIATGDGAELIENLRAGDLVTTKDSGELPIVWIGHSSVSSRQLDNAANLRPIRIAGGALGKGVPEDDLIVSPQHRILLRSPLVQDLFGKDEVLAAAKQLVAVEGIDVVEDRTQVDYFHILLDRHAILTSNGTETESLFNGPEALKAIMPALREDLLAHHPDIAEVLLEPARPILPGRDARRLAAEHVRQSLPLVA